VLVLRRGVSSREEGCEVPSIDFEQVFRMATLGEILPLLGYGRSDKAVVAGRGPCPFGCHSDPRCCTFDCRNDWYCCHRCQRKGKAFKLFMECRGLGAFDAARELCQHLGKPVPWMPQGRRRRRQSGQAT
jgi:hypothetical protein